MRFDIDGTGEREYVASVRTLMIYEQEFGGSLIADCYGRVEVIGGDGEVVTAGRVKQALRSALPEGEELPQEVSDLVDRAFPQYFTAALDYTTEHWEADVRAMWAMRKTADEMAGEPTPSFKDWVASLGPVNMTDLSHAILEESQRGLFRAAS